MTAPLSLDDMRANVARSQGHVATQNRIIETLKEQGHVATAARAAEILKTMRDHLELEIDILNRMEEEARLGGNT